MLAVLASSCDALLWVGVVEEQRASLRLNDTLELVLPWGPLLLLELDASTSAGLIFFSSEPHPLLLLSLLLLRSPLLVCGPLLRSPLDRDDDSWKAPVDGVERSLESGDSVDGCGDVTTNRSPHRNWRSSLSFSTSSKTVADSSTIVNAAGFGGSV